MREFFRYVSDLRERGVEYVANRFYSSYAGKVEDVQDPQSQGRVRVTVKGASGRSTALAEWAYPISPFAGQDKGFFFPPDPGDPVYVEFDHGNPQIPRAAGSWWCNPSPDKSPDKSHVPREFAYVNGFPKRRGIKTKQGHGLLFDDDYPLVQLWSGLQETAGAAATKKHLLEFNDKPGEERAFVESYGGHLTVWQDVAGKEKLEHISKKKHFVRIDDVEDEILVSTVDGNKIQISQKLAKILITTKAGQVVELTDGPAGVRVQDITGNIIKTTPTGVTVTAPGTVAVIAGGAASVTSGGAATITAGGALGLTGASLAFSTAGVASMAAQGTSSSKFTGLRSESYLGALNQTIVGILNVLATSYQLVTASAQIGSVGTKFRLIDERFLDFYLAHTHTSNGPDLATSDPLVSPPTNSIVTNSLRGN